MSSEHIADIRREYALGKLEAEQLDADPLQQLQLWLEQSIHAKLADPTAMILASVDPNGQPSQRTVLLKGMAAHGLVFYTNTHSRKALEIKHNNRVSLHFPWHALERQVKICGTAEPLSAAENRDYFLSRPRGSQLAAWASEQSQPIASRAQLLAKFQAVEQQFAGGDIPLPEFWGGYRITPHEIEFWQGGEHRLHDRFVYRRANPGAAWSMQRLMP